MLKDTTPSRVTRITWVGLFIALFMMLIVRQLVSRIYPMPTFSAALWKEALMWASAIALLILVRRGEHLPFRSIGIGRVSWINSLLWGLVLAIVCLAVAVVLVALTG